MGWHGVVHPTGRGGADIEVLTAAPLPEWADLLRAAFSPAADDAERAAPWCREGDIAGWLSRSAWSMALIVLWRRQVQPDTNCVVWIPDFFCNATLAALRRTGAHLHFYPVTDDLEPDWTACKTLAESNVPNIFFLVHFFGRPNPVGSAREFCRRHGVWLVEDATHVLRSVKGIGESGDFVIYSPHKHLAIPDGAVLVVRDSGVSQLGREVIAGFGRPAQWVGQLRFLEEQLATRSSWTAAWLWLIKRMLQKIGVAPAPRIYPPYSENVTPVIEDATPLLTPGQSGLSRRLISPLLKTLGQVARHRQRNQLLWDAVVPPDVSVGKRCMGREWTPYLASYAVPPAHAASVYEAWCRRGMRATTWPDLPPEVIADRERHLVAWNMRHSRLYLPVHQTVGVRDIVRVSGTPHNEQAAKVTLRLDQNFTDAAQWQQWLAQTGQSSLLQSWAYGEAKAKQGGWRVRRAVFYQGEQPVAMAQVLQKRIAGVLTVNRINRGPIFLQIPSPQVELAVWQGVSLMGNLWRGQVLSIAPELILSGPTLHSMAQLGFRQFTPRAWESIWLNLAPSEAALRLALDAKWRNMLVFAEKSGLTLEVGNDTGLFDWMMARYAELMQQKHFQGPPIELLRALRENVSESDPLFVLRAMNNNEPVAGICLACHGQTATYLVGWNGAQGRTLKANQFLLWQAIVQLKQRGLRWLDLGGVDDENTPGITAFKSGLNGTRYELVGEYWKW